MASGHTRVIIPLPIRMKETTMRLPADIGHLILEEEGRSESWAAKQELSGSSHAIRQNRNFITPLLGT